MRSQYPVGDPAEEFMCTELYAGDYIIGVKSKGELLVIADLDRAYARSSQAGSRCLVDEAPVHADLDGAGAGAPRDHMDRVVGPGPERKLGRRRVGGCSVYHVDPAGVVPAIEVDQPRAGRVV